MMTILLCLALLPLAVLLDLLSVGRKLASLAQRRRGVPLQQRNITRATCAAFVLVVCAVLAVYGFPLIGWQATAGIAALALLYLVAGILGSQGARFDFINRVFWPAVLALGCVAFLVFIGGFRL
jgi:hypothetical protein